MSPRNEISSKNNHVLLHYGLLLIGLQFHPFIPTKNTQVNPIRGLHIGENFSWKNKLDCSSGNGNKPITLNLDNEVMLHHCYESRYKITTIDLKTLKRKTINVYSM